MKWTGVLVIFCLIPLTITAQAPVGVHSSNAGVEAMYAWASKKARTHVITGKSGAINKSEQSPGTPGQVYAPGYWAGYPYRSAYYSRDFCHQAVGAHLLGLDTENFTMMQAFAASANAKQDWYPVWALNFDGSIYTLDYHSATDFVREVPAVFELVEKVWTLYRWTGDKRYIEDPVIWNFCSKAVTDFISLHDYQFPNGVAEGSATGNIFKGSATYNEEADIPALEAGDGIACQFAAFRAYAGLAAARGEVALSNIFNQKAIDLFNYFNATWRIGPGDAFVVRVYDKQHRPFGGWGKENSWFMPMKGIMNGSQTTLRYLDFIDQAARSVQGRPSNIEATTYLPEIFFKYHKNQEGWRWMEEIMDSAQVEEKGNYPEVSFVAVSNIIQDLMGIEPDVAEGSISTCSHLPNQVSDLEVDNLQFGRYSISVQHIGVNKTILNNYAASGLISWTARFQGLYPTVVVNGKRMPGRLVDDRGLRETAVTLAVKPGEKMTVEVK